jgi:putative N6-adenine-specific DNA methylase
LSSNPSERSESFFAPCPRGLEALLAGELRALGASEVAALAGGVAFTGGWETCYAANFHSRIASRVLWRVAEFAYANEHDVYAAARAIPWGEYFTVGRSIRVNMTAIKSPLKSLDFTTLRIKDAVCDVFRDAVGERPNVERLNPDVRIHAFLEEKKGALYLDTSGEPLFKRGWRRAVVEAPLRENLAAGILMLSGWKFDEPLLDPMCGGGTLLIEAAAMALNEPPGAGREFGFEKLSTLDLKAWNRVRDGRPPRNKLRPQLFGSDIEQRAVESAKKNLMAAGFYDLVRLQRQDILRLEAPAAAGVMVANPPYGERLADAEQLAAFYPELGHALKRNFAGWRCHFFTADLRMAKLIRLSPSRRVPLYNGALECRLFEFGIVAGSNRGNPGAR